MDVSTLLLTDEMIFTVGTLVTMSNEFIVKFRPIDKVECCFDIVAGVDGA